LFLAVSILPIALGILAYIFNKHHKKFLIFSYIITFIILIISKEGSVVAGGWDYLKGIEFVFNGETRILLISFFVFSVIMYLRIHKIYGYEFTLMWLILNGSINSFFMSRDFFNIYVHFELISMIIFLMMAIDKNSKRIWASLKYMIMSAVALDFYLIGIAFLYSKTGTLNITASIEHEFPIFAATFLIIGLLIKSGVVFLSGWLPDAHGEAARGISPILSGVLVKMGLYVIYLISPGLNSLFLNFLFYFGLVSALIASFLTVIQNDLKKVLAYSTMTQMSYGIMLIAVRPEFFVFFIIYHMFSKGFIFALAEDIYQKYGTKSLDELKGKVLSFGQYIFFALLLINMSGIFPSSMFIFKKAMYSPIILDLNLIFFGIYFIKVMTTFKTNFKLQIKYIYIFIFVAASIFLNYYLVEIEFKIIILQYSLFILGTLLYSRQLKNKNLIFEIHKLDRSIIYQLTFILFLMLMEIFIKI
jgi:multicomponent Na+:H+ antiporter subunit D